jgi:hypothetical protein
MEDASPEEQEIMREHFEYLKSDARKLILAGPSLEPPFGIIVLEAESEEEARRLTAALSVGRRRSSDARAAPAPRFAAPRSLAVRPS